MTGEMAAAVPFSSEMTVLRVPCVECVYCCEREGVAWPVVDAGARRESVWGRTLLSGVMVRLRAGSDPGFLFYRASGGARACLAYGVCGVSDVFRPSVCAAVGASWGWVGRGWEGRGRAVVCGAERPKNPFPFPSRRFKGGIQQTYNPAKRSYFKVFY